MSKISMAAGGTAGIEEKISWLQKLLLYFLYVLAILMIVFSILAVGNLDERIRLQGVKMKQVGPDLMIEGSLHV